MIGSKFLHKQKRNKINTFNSVAKIFKLVQTISLDNATKIGYNRVTTQEIKKSGRAKRPYLFFVTPRKWFLWLLCLKNDKERMISL